MADRRAVNSHDASTVVSVVNIQQARPSTIDMPWRNFRSPQLGTKFQREVLLFLEIPEFPYNTVYLQYIGLLFCIVSTGILPARRYASAGTSCGPMSVCVCHKSVSVTSWCSIEMDGRIELVLASRLRSIYPTLCYTENHVSTIWNFSLNSGLLKISLRHIDRRNVLST